jgi:hypothetical protein
MAGSQHTFVSARREAEAYTPRYEAMSCVTEIMVSQAIIAQTNGSKGLDILERSSARYALMAYPATTT